MNNNLKSIVLLSSGIDSLVSLATAKLKTNVILSLTIDYGQIAAENEIESAEKIAHHYNVEHKTIDLKWIKDYSKSHLTGYDSLPLIENNTGSTEELLKASRKVWVANRNGMMINIAAFFAESLNANLIVTGFNAEEAENFPDNSHDFIKAINKSLSYSTLNHVIAKSYTIKMTKKQIVKLAYNLNIPWELLWSCYNDHGKMCGNCESCFRLKRALTQTGVFEKVKERVRF